MILAVITAKVAVATDTPIRADTYVGLEFQGLTGVPVIALEGRSNMPAPRIRRGLPVLIADPAAGVSMTQAARDALDQFESPSWRKIRSHCTARSQT